MARKKKAEKETAFYDSTVAEMPDDEPVVEAADDGTSITRLADGGLEVDFTDSEDGADDADKPFEPKEFDENLADELTAADQTALGMKIKEFVEIDITTRATWERRMEDGLEVIGLEDVPDDAVAFEGAARVTYPGIAEAMVQFQARAMEELMPPEGPVKCGVSGSATDELEDQAERVQDYMNYQLMEEDDEYYQETDELLLYLPYAGSAFRKVSIDPVTGRTRSRFIPAVDFIVPYDARSLATAPRYTHRYTMSKNTYLRAVESGYFIDADFGNQQPTVDNESRRLADVSDDREEARHQDDDIYTFCETTCDEDFEWDADAKDKDARKFKKPYAITWEWETGRVVRIVRCWDENDPRCKRDVWFTHYKFLPGLGFYGWGYLHIIGGLGKAASGALRLLLDGSATSSLQGGFKTRDARIAGETTFTPGEWQDVDMTAEELAKSFYSPPYKEPSPALFKTLEILVNGIQRFTSTTEAMVGDSPSTGPVGTMVAIIEQGSKLLSGIHKRIHAAARREFKMIAACNYRYMGDEEYPYDVAGEEKKVMRTDFSPKVDVIPVSDPNIYSNVQRIALAQAVVELQNQKPELYPKQSVIRAHRNMLKALRVPDWDEYLPEKQVKRMDPVSENESILNGMPVQAFREQDDDAHLAVHAAFEQEIMGMDPEIQQMAIPAMKAHKAAHFAQAYRKRVEAQVLATAGVPLPPFDLNNPDDNEELPIDIENAVAIAAAQYAPPPPPPSAEGADEAATQDMLATREADRKDMLAQREADRKDGLAAAEMKRQGLIPDVDEEPLIPPGV